MEPTPVSLTAPDSTRLVAARFDAGPGPAVVIVHGLDSRGRNHADFAGRLVAAGITALTIDLRGHGDSGGGLDAGTPGDVGVGLDHLAGRGHGPLGLRGSSLGGFLCVAAAGSDARVRALVAIATARPGAIARRIERDWPTRLDLERAVRRRSCARLYLHATRDEVVPWGHSARLAGHSRGPTRLRVELGGSHTSLQHDPEIQDLSTRFLAEHLGA